ncbi:MAG: FAD-dependent oxidoreductase [Thermoleophilia bacterium]|nr:FAD-dependent oxidoreductase [Thermoleophilia bacterium]
MSNEDVVIVGGGLAAQRCCETLRRGGHDGSITIVCGETSRPYDRPPLSKNVLAGQQSVDDLAFRPADWYDEQDVELLLGKPATALDTSRRTVVLHDGGEVSYDKLLIATGSTPRRLPLLDGYPNVLTLRDVDDALTLKRAIAPGVRLIVIGAGFIGQEVAATARKLGAEVTILEALPEPLVGILGPELGSWFAQVHREEGVQVLCSTTATEVELDADGRVEALVTNDGRRLECDVIVVGIGVVAADTWLADSELSGGIEIDELGRTSLPGVFAAGDVARQVDPYLGVHARSEHWESAGRQGVAAARAMLGQDVASSPPASFWSDQYGLRIQYLGYSANADSVMIDGDPFSRNFSAVWKHGDRPIGALLVNRQRLLPQLRRDIHESLQIHHEKEQVA